MYAPSQWETTLQCNFVSHWLEKAVKLNHSPTLIGWVNTQNDPWTCSKYYAWHVLKMYSFDAIFHHVPVVWWEGHKLPLWIKRMLFLSWCQSIDTIRQFECYISIGLQKRDVTLLQTNSSLPVFQFNLTDPPNNSPTWNTRSYFSVSGRAHDTWSKFPCGELKQWH